MVGDDVRKTILLCSGWYMGKQEFGQFLLAVADLADEGKVSPHVFLWCQWPIESPLHGFMLHNRNPVVREVKAQSAKLFAAEAERREAAKARGESLDGLFPLPPDSLWEILPGDDGIVPSAWRLPLAAGSGALVLAGCGIWLWRKRRKNGGPRGIR